jgi:hypothetical protein
MLTLALQTEQTVSILIWSGVLIVLVLVLFFVVNAIRKAASDQHVHDDSAPFSLDELRQMHRDGRLSDEEFDKARAQVIAIVSGSAGDPSDDPAGSGESAESVDLGAESPDNDDEEQGNRS